jgi:hypothetical protein
LIFEIILNGIIYAFTETTVNCHNMKNGLAKSNFTPKRIIFQKTMCTKYCITASKSPSKGSVILFKRSVFIRLIFIQSKFIQSLINARFSYCYKKLYGQILCRSKFIQFKIYTVQNLFSPNLYSLGQQPTFSFKHCKHNNHKWSTQTRLWLKIRIERKSYEACSKFGINKKN